MLTLILICVLLGLLLVFRRRRNTNEPPTFPGALPLIGHVHLLLGTNELWNLLNMCLDECQKCDGAISLFIGFKPIYVISDPEDFMTVANSCLEKNNFYGFAKPWTGEGLITGTVPIWKLHRKLLNPAFNQKVLDGFLDVFNKQARRLVKDLEIEIDKISFDHYNYIQRIALETICFTALGMDLNQKSESNSQYIMAVDQMLNIFTERIQKFWLHNDMIYNWTQLKKKQDECLKILHAMSNTILQKTKADHSFKTKKESKFKTFMHILLELVVEKKIFNDREIREEVDTMIVAGYETVTSALVYTVLMIGSYPRVQEKVIKELHHVFGDDDKDVTKQDLSRLCYLEAVIKETLRFYPVIPVVARYLDQDVKLRNCTLSKGSTCVLFINGVHRNQIWGSDADVFKPERWLEPGSLPKSPGAFAGFSIGKRNCIGKAYAFTSLKTTLAHVFRNYKVQGDHTNMELKFDIVLKPVSGHHISIQKRNKDVNGTSAVN